MLVISGVKLESGNKKLKRLKGKWTPWLSNFPKMTIMIIISKKLKINEMNVMIHQIDNVKIQFSTS